MLAQVSRNARRSLIALLGLLLAASVLAVLAQPASAAAYHAPSHKRTSYELYVARKVLSRLNTERHAHHLPALSMNSDLDSSARRHNMTMAFWNQMSHQLPREPFFANRISQAGYRWSWAGENVAWNSQMNAAGVLALENFMYNEKAPNNGHRLNILSSHYRNVGIDVYVDRQHRKIWLTEDFGAH